LLVEAFDKLGLQLGKLKGDAALSLSLEEWPMPVPLIQFFHVGV
jgi:hypothetical protein